MRNDLALAGGGRTRGCGFEHEDDKGGVVCAVYVLNCPVWLQWYKERGKALCTIAAILELSRSKKSFK